MHRSTPLILACVLLAHAALAGASPLDRFSLRVQGGANWPSATSSRVLPMPSQGTSLGAGLVYDAAPALRLTADVTRDRFGGGGGFVSVPEVSLRGSEPFTLVTALMGFELRAALPRGSRGALHAGLASGAGWLQAGRMRFDDMNGPSFTVGGGHETHPVVAASLGVQVPTGLAHADLDLGWRELWMDHAYGALRSGAFRGGVVVRH